MVLKSDIEPLYFNPEYFSQSHQFHGKSPQIVYHIQGKLAVALASFFSDVSLYTTNEGNDSSAQFFKSSDCEYCVVNASIAGMVPYQHSLMLKVTNNHFCGGILGLTSEQMVHYLDHLISGTDLNRYCHSIM